MDVPSVSIRCVVIEVFPNEVECVSNEASCFWSKASNCCDWEGVRSELMAAARAGGDAARPIEGTSKEAALKETTEIDCGAVVQANVVPLGIRIYSDVGFVAERSAEP